MIIEAAELIESVAISTREAALRRDRAEVRLRLGHLRRAVIAAIQTITEMDCEQGTVLRPTIPQTSALRLDSGAKSETALSEREASLSAMHDPTAAETSRWEKMTRNRRSSSARRYSRG
jgi:hypothetical protein